MQAVNVTEMLSRVERIAPFLAEHRDAAEQAGQLDKAVVAVMREIGLFALPVPLSLGGAEMRPTDLYQIWEAVARIDSAAGWNLAQASAGIVFAGRLGEDGLNRVFGAIQQPYFAGAGNPPLSGTKVEGGYIVNGRVPFVTGAHHADWLFFVMLPLQDGKPVMDPVVGRPMPHFVFVPPSDVTLLDNWDVLGMRATGSTDVELSDLFVPDAMTVPAAPPSTVHPAFAGALYRMQPWPVIHGEALVSIAIAASAIDLFRQTETNKVPAMSQVALAEREWVQLNVGRAQAQVDAARAYLHRTAADAYAKAEHGALDREARTALQLAACYAAEAGAKAVDLIHECAGSSGIRNDKMFQRHFRDIHVCTQHATKSVARYVSAGRLLLGLDADVPLLAS